MSEVKNIKDYLHLYLGCEGVTSDGRKMALTVGNLGFAINPIYGDFKPLLRPLSGITEEELQECGNLVYDFSDDDSGLGLNDHKWEDFQTVLCAEQFHWLLQRHFDLFDLIESGLAIDKTKHLTPNL